MTPPAVVWAPRHLGDGVLALPALAALAAARPTFVFGPPWVADLYGHLGIIALPTGAPAPADAALALLFAPSFRAALQARAIPRRIGLATDHRWPLLTIALDPAGPHRLDDFAALAAAAGHPAAGLPALPATRPSPVDPPPGAVLLLAGGRSTATTGWPHHRALADALAAAGRPPFFAGGPDERAALAATAGPHPLLGLDAIPAFVAAVPRFSALLGHDAGLSHLAAAALRGAGAPVDRLRVLYASTDPDRTGPPGAAAIVGPRPACAPCYRKSCPFDRGCAAIGVEAVLRAVTAVGPPAQASVPGVA